MITGPSPFKVVKTSLHTWISEGPYKSGNQWKSEQQALRECDILNSVYNSGYFANVDQPRLAKLESDVAHAWKCAKLHCPDYPWDETRQTASQAVYACGGAYEGVSKACDDWRRLFAHLAPEAYASLVKMAMEEPKAYDSLVKKLEENDKK